MKPPPVDYLEVTGIDGLHAWPESNVISHVQPESITLSWFAHEFKVEFQSGSESYKFDSINGVVNIPASTTAGVIDNHGALKVYVDDVELFGGIIIFLPWGESEPFPISQYITANGSFINNNFYRSTDFIDVRLAKTVIYKGRLQANNHIKVFGYDDKKNPVRILLGPDTNDSTPVSVDFEGVSYIVASAQNGYGSLTVYYKDRRQR